MTDPHGDEAYAAEQARMTSEYRTLFDDIERWLRLRCREDVYTPFRSLIVHQRARLGNAVQRQLTNHAEIRNVMSHGYLAGDPPVAPTYAALAELRAIHASLVEPPLVLSVLRGAPVVTCSSSQPLKDALSVMTRQQYDQLPVIEGRMMTGLLTSVGISRWLGARLADEGGVLADEATVGEVVGHEAPDHLYLLVDRGVRTPAVLEMFEKAMLDGRTLDAVLITETGSASEGLLGIVVPDDLPALVGG